uniref:Uncharacterized protein n=1 Tax=Cacopsylla melanoneura TaxID=428564 RepID=A0A8D8SDE9_9HEMI
MSDCTSDRTRDRMSVTTNAACCLRCHESATFYPPFLPGPGPRCMVWQRPLVAMIDMKQRLYAARRICLRDAALLPPDLPLMETTLRIHMRDQCMEITLVIPMVKDWGLALAAITCRINYRATQPPRDVNREPS